MSTGADSFRAVVADQVLTELIVSSLCESMRASAGTARYLETAATKLRSNVSACSSHRHSTSGCHCTAMIRSTSSANASTSPSSVKATGRAW